MYRWGFCEGGIVVSEQQTIKYLAEAEVCEVHKFCSWVRPCPYCGQSLRDELLTALLEHHNYDSLYASCMELVERYREPK